MVQQGQVCKLKAKGANGQALWAYRYRLEGRGSARPQVGGFASRAEAKKALQKVVERLGPAGRGASLTLGELVEEYLEMHQAEPGLLSLAPVLVLTDDMLALHSSRGSTVTKPNMPSLTK